MALNENIMIRLMANTSDYNAKMKAASAQAQQLQTALEKPMTSGQKWDARLTRTGIALGSLAAGIGIAAVSQFA